MALTLNRSDRFPVGTSVGAYPRRAHVVGGRPVGAAVETHTVDAAGSLTFTTLTADEPYCLYALVGEANRYLDVADSGFTEPPTGLIERIDQKRVAAGIE